MPRGRKAPRSARLRDALGPVLEHIYESALNPGHWPETLDCLIEYFGARGAVLRTSACPPKFGNNWVSQRLEPWVLEEYARKYHRCDVWRQAAGARGLFRAGVIATSDDIVPRAELLASSFYRNFLIRADMHDLLATILHDGTASPTPLVSLSLYRGHRQPLFDARHVSWMQALTPHLARAVAINFQISDRDSRLSVADVAFDELSPPLALFDRALRLLRMNRRARELLAAGDGLRLDENRLAAASEADTRRLSALLAGDGVTDSDTAVATIARPSGRQPYLVMRVPLSLDYATPPDAQMPHVALLFHDPDAAAETSLEGVAARFGLTQTETRVLELLLRWGSVKSILQHTDLNHHTLRGHIKSLLRKTGTSAQAELIRLALSASVRRTH